jgi:histidine triad (HIT) family protein
MDDCIFCKIIKKEVPATVVFETEKVLAFMDIKPINPGHVLVIPKIHSEFISGVSEEDLQEMMLIGGRINSALRKSGIKCTGVNLFLADGVDAGQEVPHVHLHVIPRFEKDGFGFKFPLGYETMPERSELVELSEKIKKAI